MLFNVFRNDHNKGVKYTLNKFANDSKLAGTVVSVEGRKALQRDLDRLQSWAVINSVKFNTSRCQILHLVQGNPGYTYEGQEPGK